MDWMLAAGFSAHDFFAGFEACKLALEQKQRIRSVTAASVFIRFLQHQGKLPLPTTALRGSELWPLLGEFRCWMREHRGLTDATLNVYEGILTDFLMLWAMMYGSIRPRLYARLSSIGRVLTGSIALRALSSRYARLSASLE
jgi:hypothetical protein